MQNLIDSRSVPKVSILMCVRNNFESLIYTIESVLGQSHKNFEFIIVDDYSDEGITDIIDSFNDKRIIFLKNYYEPGIANALNCGILFCNTNYIFRIDSDDFFYPYKIQLQINFLIENPDILVLGSRRLILKKNRIIMQNDYHGEVTKSQLMRKNLIINSSVAINTFKINKKHITFNNNNNTSEDYELWSRLITKGKIFILPDILLIYTESDSQVSKKNRIKQEMGSLNIRKNLILNETKISLKTLLNFVILVFDYSKLIYWIMKDYLNKNLFR